MTDDRHDICLCITKASALDGAGLSQEGARFRQAVTRSFQRGRRALINVRALRRLIYRGDFRWARQQTAWPRAGAMRGEAHIAAADFRATAYLIAFVAFDG